MSRSHKRMGGALPAEKRPEALREPLAAALRTQRRLEEAVGYFHGGRMAEAERACLGILSEDARQADALYLLAMTLGETQRPGAAAAMMRRALAVESGRAHYHALLANALAALGQGEEAAASYERALKLDPGYAEALYNFANLRRDQGRAEDSIRLYERALKAEPGHILAANNLGLVLRATGRGEEAVECFRALLERAPNYAKAHNNLGEALKSLGRMDEALECYERALEIEPGYREVRWNRGLVELLRGNFAQGWRDYEARWGAQGFETPARTYAQPLWTGKPRGGERVLLWSEQGVGDEIMFAGFVPLAAGSGQACVLECDPRLKPLFARSFPRVEVLARGETLPGFGAHLPTGSLPGLYWAEEARPLRPFLKADKGSREEFRARYGDGRPLVGFAWQTLNRKTGPARSLALETAGALFSVPGVRWISLQYGAFEALEEQAARAGAPLTVDRTVDQFADMDRFAAQVAAMDLVVTIDNSTAHLAGALGVPVWLLLPALPDWRWQMGREDTPWYPTMRLLRQRRQGDWGRVLERVREGLKGFAGDAGREG